MLLSGPTFYICFLIACIIVRLQKEKLAKTMRTGAPSVEPNDCFEVAYLARGDQRVLSAGLRALLSRGLVRYEAQRLTALSTGEAKKITAGEALHPVEDELLKALQAGPRRPDDLQSCELLGVEFTKLVKSLRARGYLSSEAHTQRENRLFAISAGLVLLLWARVYIGCGEEDWLIARLFFATVPTLFVLAVSESRFVSNLRRARPVIKMLEKKYAALCSTSISAPEQLEPHELAMACALSGTEVFTGSLAALKSSLPAEEEPVVSTWNLDHPGKTQRKSKKSKSGGGVVGTCGDDSDGGDGGDGGCGGCGGD